MSEPESDPEEEPFEFGPEEVSFESESEEDESNPEEEPLKFDPEEVFNEEDDPNAYLIPTTPPRRELRARLDMSDSSPHMTA